MSEAPSHWDLHSDAKPLGAQTLIEKLNEAEQKSDSIIEDAKKNRKALLSKARQAAQEELQAFSAQQEETYRAMIGAGDHGDAAEALAAVTSRELNEVESDFVSNKEKTVGYVVEKVLDVYIALSSTQKQALVDEAAQGPSQAHTSMADPVKLAKKGASAVQKAGGMVSGLLKKLPSPRKKGPAAKEEEVEEEEEAAEEEKAQDEPPAVAPAADAPAADASSGRTVTITLKNIKCTAGDKKMDPFVEIKYGGMGTRSNVVRDGGRDAVLDEELPALPLQPGVELVLTVGDFDKAADGKPTKEAIGSAKPFKIEELETDDAGIFEGSFDLFKTKGKPKATGKLFVKIEVSS